MTLERGQLAPDDRNALKLGNKSQREGRMREVETVQVRVKNTHKELRPLRTVVEILFELVQHNLETRLGRT